MLPMEKSEGQEKCSEERLVDMDPGFETRQGCWFESSARPISFRELTIISAIKFLSLTMDHCSDCCGKEPVTCEDFLFK